MEGLYFRTTTAEDYDNVISIREHLYNGMDYIPSRYHKLLETNTGFAGFIDNRMVSFMFAAIIDDGKRIIIQSIRVRKEYEGRGIFSRMRKFCMTSLSHEADTHVFVIRSFDLCEKLLRKSAKLIFKRNKSMYDASKTSIQSFLGSRPMSTSLKQVDKSCLESVISSGPERQDLFPENRIVLYNVVYEFLFGNVENILSRSEMVATANSNIEGVGRNHPLTVSACTYDKCERGTIVYFDLFGNINNENVVYDHINVQLERFMEGCESNIVLYVTYSTNRDTTALRQVLAKLGCRTIGEHILYGIEMPI